MATKASWYDRFEDFGDELPSSAKSHGSFPCLSSSILFLARACFCFILLLLILAIAIMALVPMAFLVAAQHLGQIAGQIVSLLVFGALYASLIGQVVWLLLTGQIGSCVLRLLELIDLLSHRRW